MIESFTLEGKSVDDAHLERIKKTPLIFKGKKFILGNGGRGQELQRARKCRA